MNLPLASSSLRIVLVVSSGRANLQLITQLIATRDDLKRLTATANNGTDGLKWAGACQPEVVVVDTGLSDMSAR